MAEACRACGNTINHVLFSGYLRKLEVNYFECKNCGYVQTQQPTWLDEAYSEAINASDTGIMQRNISNVRLVLSTLALLKSMKGCVVDCAGGHGFLVRMLRDIGVDAYWDDPFATNLVAKGFEFNGGQADLATAFEAFEHFVNPNKEIKRLLEIAPSILFTTSLIPTPAPNPHEWWYYGKEHGQHVGFFRVRTLQYIAERFNLNLLTDKNSIHLLSRNKLSSRRWHLYNKLSRLNLGFLTKNLRSKTWDDHLLTSSLSSRPLP